MRFQSGSPRALLPLGRTRLHWSDSADGCATLLQLQGHDVRAAYSGAEALRLAEHFKPQLAVLDIGMPKMNARCADQPC